MHHVHTKKDSHKQDRYNFLSSEYGGVAYMHVLCTQRTCKHLDNSGTDSRYLIGQLQVSNAVETLRGTLNIG